MNTEAPAARLAQRRGMRREEGHAPLPTPVLGRRSACYFQSTLETTTTPQKAIGGRIPRCERITAAP